MQTKSTQGWAFWRDATKKTPAADKAGQTQKVPLPAFAPKVTVTQASQQKQVVQDVSAETLQNYAASRVDVSAQSKAQAAPVMISSEAGHGTMAAEAKVAHVDTAVGNGGGTTAAPVVVKPDWAVAKLHSPNKRTDYPDTASQPKAKRAANLKAAQKAQKSESDDWPPGDFRIYVSNLGPEVDDAMLRAAFEPHGALTGCRVVRERHSGRSRGFGFVGFADVACYIAAMRALDKRYIGSRPVRLCRSEWSTGQMPSV